MPCRKYIQQVFALIEIVIVLAVIAILVASTLPGFLRARKRSQALKVPSEPRTTHSALDPIAITKVIDGRVRILTRPVT